MTGSPSNTDVDMQPFEIFQMLIHQCQFMIKSQTRIKKTIKAVETKINKTSYISDIHIN